MTCAVLGDAGDELTSAETYTFETGGMSLPQRLAMIVRDGTIKPVLPLFLPISAPPDIRVGCEARFEFDPEPEIGSRPSHDRANATKSKRDDASEVDKDRGMAH